MSTITGPEVSTDRVEGHVLWRTWWMAVHAPATCASAAEVNASGKIIFGKENVIMEPGTHEWDMGPGERFNDCWQGRTDWFFVETRL